MTNLNVYKSVLLAVILCVIANGGYSQKKTRNNPFFFIQVTDPQFGFIEANKGFGSETGLYEKAVKEINRLKPAFVVITGDLVNNKDARSQIAEFKRITAVISPGIPVWFTPGNHDIGQSPGQKDIDMFISDYGHDRFSFKYKKWRFIGLNSSIIKSNTPLLEQQQFTWLKNELSNVHGSGRTVLFCHYPFFITEPDEPESYSNIPVETRSRYLSLFKENKVTAVFAGHLHNNGYGRSGEMEMITTSAVGKPLGKAPSGFRIVKVYPDRIESEFYSLDEIPAKIGF